MSWWGRQTVTLIRRTPTGPDDYGNTAYREDATVITGALVQPTLVAREELGQADITVTRWKIWVQPTVDLASVDAIDVDGERFEVEGDPMHWPDFHGGIHHIEAYLKKISVVGTRNVPPAS